MCSPWPVPISSLLPRRSTWEDGHTTPEYCKWHNFTENLTPTIDAPIEMISATRFRFATRCFWPIAVSLALCVQHHFTGYPTLNWMLTPVLGVNLTAQQRRYNVAHR